MALIELKKPTDVSGDEKLMKAFASFANIISELAKMKLSPSVAGFVNDCVGDINHTLLSGSELRKLLKQKQAGLLKHLEKEAKIVPKSYYRNLWMVLGMSGIGLPIGAAFGLSLGNIALMSVGMPIGMGIGAAAGASMDRKALREGRQLNLTI